MIVKGPRCIHALLFIRAKCGAGGEVHLKMALITFDLVVLSCWNSCNRTILKSCIGQRNERWAAAGAQVICSFLAGFTRLEFFVWIEILKLWPTVKIWWRFSWFPEEGSKQHSIETRQVQVSLSQHVIFTLMFWCLIEWLVYVWRPRWSAQREDKTVEKASLCV